MTQSAGMERMQLIADARTVIRDGLREPWMQDLLTEAIDALVNAQITLDEDKQYMTTAEVHIIDRCAQVAEGINLPLAHCCDHCSIYSESWNIAVAIRALAPEGTK